MDYKEYEGLKYSSDMFKSSLENLDISQSFYLSNQRDKPNYSYISWRMHGSGEFSKYQEQGEGYFVSSIILLEQCLEENRDRKGDVVIFPILFNVEQGIELYIKAFMYLLRASGANISSRLLTHDIKTLLSDYMDAVSSFDPDLASISCRDFDTLKQFIDYLFEKTGDCTYARFPFDTRENAHFYVDSSENIIIDMQQLLEWVKAAFYIVDRNYNLLRYELESREMI